MTPWSGPNVNATFAQLQNKTTTDRDNIIIFAIIITLFTDNQIVTWRKYSRRLLLGTKDKDYTLRPIKDSDGIYIYILLTSKVRTAARVRAVYTGRDPGGGISTKPVGLMSLSRHHSSLEMAHTCTSATL